MASCVRYLTLLLFCFTPWNGGVVASSSLLAASAFSVELDDDDIDAPAKRSKFEQPTQAQPLILSSLVLTLTAPEFLTGPPLHEPRFSASSEAALLYRFMSLQR